MTNNIYALYNRLSLRYGDVYSFPSDGYAANQLRRAMVNDKQDLTTEYELCNVGSIDIDSGTIYPHDPVRVAWNAGDANLGKPVTEAQ